MSFSTSKRGYDTTEVNSFVTEVAEALETAQNGTRAMEARARAAVARLQELTHDGDTGGVETAVPTATANESETISRTLLLAQRTADNTVAEARAEAERIVAAAHDDAALVVANAKEDARNAGEGERIRVESEVQALSARRDFLEADVDSLESFLIEQRERIRESATTLSQMVERIPGGLGVIRKPLLSASTAAAGESARDDDDYDDTQPYDPFPGSDEQHDSGIHGDREPAVDAEDRDADADALADLEATSSEVPAPDHSVDDEHRL